MLRSAKDDNAKRQIYSPELEAHDMGGILARAVFDAFRVVYDRKTERFLQLATNGTGQVPNGCLSSNLVSILADEASKLASQFLSICVRALDYCPPVDIKLGEFLCGRSPAHVRFAIWSWITRGIIEKP